MDHSLCLEFHEFQRQWQFNHQTSSPHFPQANGKVENAVKIAKDLMTKAQKTNSDPYLGLLMMRNTPSQGMSTSPAQRLMSRRTRTVLPTHTELLKPAINKEAYGELQAAKNCQKHYFDRSAKDLPELASGEVVRVQPQQKGLDWKKARVIKCLGNRSYLVETEGGDKYRRNRKQLRAVKEDFTGEQESGQYRWQLDEDQDQQEQEEEQGNNSVRPEETSTSEPYKTRSGRTVRPSHRFQDYVTDTS